MGFWSTLGSVVSAPVRGIKALGHLGDESDSAVDKRNALNAQARAAGGFAGVGEQNYNQLTAEARRARGDLRDVAMGKNSIAAEQLRQGLQQNLGIQQGMAASASPQNAAAAARTAAMQAGRLGAGFAGQQAIAGLQERQQAQQALAQMIAQQRGQDLQAALGSRQNAISGYGGVTPEGSWLDKWGGAITAGAGIAAKSDERLKEDIKDGDSAANRALRELRAFTFKYKDGKHGQGKQLGIMAQDLERAGLGHAVIDEPDGKAVHGAKLATTNTAMIAALGRRLEKLEGKGRKR